MSAGKGCVGDSEDEGMLCSSLAGGVDDVVPIPGIGRRSIIDRSFIAKEIGSTCSSTGADPFGAEEGWGCSAAGVGNSDTGVSEGVEDEDGGEVW
jgi:hypothetical protein